MIRRPPSSPLFPYTTLFGSWRPWWPRNPMPRNVTKSWLSRSGGPSMSFPTPTAEEIYVAAAAAGARPDPLLTVSQWADQYRTLSQRASAEPGPWRTERTPYLREIMDCLSPSSHRTGRFHESRSDRRDRVRKQLDRLCHSPGTRTHDGHPAHRGDGQAQFKAAYRSTDRRVGRVARASERSAVARFRQHDSRSEE